MLATSILVVSVLSSLAQSRTDPERSPVPSVAPPAMAASVVSDVDSQRTRSYVVSLAGFGTRHTLSDTTSATRGIGAARNWIKSELEEFSRAGGGRLQVSFEQFEQPPMARMPKGGTIVNVVAVLPGSMPEAQKRRYYVVGHYDSRNGETMDVTGDAPGANDDASGTAVVLELARVLAGRKLDATVVFLATAGEEQGLLGAVYHADQAAARGETILGVLSNDIVGDPSVPPSVGGTGDARTRIRIFSEGLPRKASAEKLAEMKNLAGECDSRSRQVARFVDEVARWHALPVQPMLIFRPDRFLRGGDHSAFNDAGFPAVRFTTVHENYDRQHANITEKDGKAYGDVPEFVDEQYLGGVARLNAAALVHLANAPSSPPNARIITASLANDTTLRWDASPEPDTAGYEVLWRLTTEATWTHCKDAGTSRDITLPLSKDDVFFGVRAYDKDGYRSPAVFPVAAKE